MNRSKMRKLAKFAIKNNLGKEAHRVPLEDALAGCHNGTTRAKLRARIQRGTER